jgi:hypothetical protein
MKADKPTKAQKGAQILKSLKTHFGNSEIGVANNLGWTIEEVIGELIERYTEIVERDLDMQEKGTESEFWKAQTEMLNASKNLRLN